MALLQEFAGAITSDNRHCPLHGRGLHGVPLVQAKGWGWEST